MILLDDVDKVYPGGVKAVTGVSLSIRKGEIYVLIGPSGCGKSTILNMINRLISATGGRILIDGVDSRQIEPTLLRRSIGYAIQETALFPHMTVRENIAVVPRLCKWEERRIAARVEELLHLIGLDPGQYADKYPAQLSGGEKQRVGVARALGADPPILLMDEPFGAIDPITRVRLQDQFLEIQEKINKTIVFVTHDIDEALKMGDHIGILNQGRLVQSGTPKDILSHPADAFVEVFMGTGWKMKWLKLIRVEEVMDHTDCFCTLDADGPEVARRMRRQALSSLPVVDGAHRLLGYVPLKEVQAGRDWQRRILPYAQVLGKKWTLFDSFLPLFADANNYLPVAEDKGTLLGLLTEAHLREYLGDTFMESEEGLQDAGADHPIQ
ncbi:MAG: betaine/proline/choline family ABC transporter ATP-binding protein [Clostridiales bacterium]|nr:betaine/proline/choline family ABC transporter ATP-binding protein [Clostridiales bacterium]